MRVSMEFSLGSGERIDLRGVLPEVVLGRAKSEISHMPVGVDGRKAKLGQVCRIHTADRMEDELVLQGDTGHLDHVGWNLQSSRLIVEGNSGWGAGEGMRGGILEVRGSAGDCLGKNMQGGTIHVTGCTGDGCGAADAGEKRGMTGGTILVDGDAGREVGAGMRSGLIWVGGRAGDFCAWRMLAGTVICREGVGKHAGVGMKRGSLVTSRLEGEPLGFRPAGKADPGWLHLYLHTLEHMGVNTPKEWLESNLNRYTGDHLELGKGEMILFHDEFK